jgi:hypothetical protein
VIRKSSRVLVVLAALALIGVAPLAAQAGDHHHGHGHGHGHRHGHGWHGGGRYYYGPWRGYYRAVAPWGVPYYYGAGAWYRPFGVGYVAVGAPIGVVVPYLPPAYTTVWYGGAPYYWGGGAYYRPAPGGYAVVAAPGTVAPPQPPAYGGGAYEDDDEEIFVYPQRGQSESRQSDDRYACHRWAVDQSGYDPTRALEGVEAASAGGGSRSDYQRAVTACLEGRGYTVR